LVITKNIYNIIFSTTSIITNTSKCNIFMVVMAKKPKSNENVIVHKFSQMKSCLMQGSVTE